MNTVSNMITVAALTPPGSTEHQMTLKQEMMKEALTLALRGGDTPGIKKWLSEGVIIDHPMMVSVMAVIPLRTVKWLMKHQHISLVDLLKEELHQFETSNLKIKISERAEHKLLRLWLPAAIEVGESLTVWMIYFGRQSSQDTALSQCIDVFLENDVRLQVSEEESKYTNGILSSLSALELASSRNQPKTLKKILQHSDAKSAMARNEEKTRFKGYGNMPNRSLLSLACESQDLSSFKMLWDYCDPNSLNAIDENIGHFLARGSNGDFLKWVKNKPLNWDQANLLGETPLHVFGQGWKAQKDLDFLKWLISKNNDATTLRGLDPLMSFLERKAKSGGKWNAYDPDIIEQFIALSDLDQLTRRDFLGCSALTKMLDNQDEDLAEHLKIKLKDKGLSESKIEALILPTCSSMNWQALKNDSTGSGKLILEDAFGRFKHTIKYHLPMETHAFIQSGLSIFDAQNPELLGSVGAIISSNHPILFDQFLEIELPSHWTEYSVFYDHLLGRSIPVHHKAPFGKEIITLIGGNENQVQKLSLQNKTLPHDLEMLLWVEMFSQGNAEHLKSTMSLFRSHMSSGLWDLSGVSSEAFSAVIQGIKKALTQKTTVMAADDYNVIGNLFLEVLFEKDPQHFLIAPLLMQAVKYQWPVIHHIEWTEPLKADVFSEETLKMLDFSHFETIKKLIELKETGTSSQKERTLLHYLSAKAHTTSAELLTEIYHHATLDELIRLDDKNEDLLMSTIDSDEHETSFFWLKKIMPDMNLHHQNLIGKTALQKATEQGKLQMAALIREYQHVHLEATELAATIQDVKKSSDTTEPITDEVKEPRKNRL